MWRYRTAIVVLAAAACLLALCNVLAVCLRLQEGRESLVAKTKADPGSSNPQAGKFAAAKLIDIIGQHYVRTTSDNERKPTITKIVAQGSTREFWMKRDPRADFCPLFVDDEGNDRGYYGVVAKMNVGGTDELRRFILKDASVVETFSSYQHHRVTSPAEKASSGRAP